MSTPVRAGRVRKGETGRGARVRSLGPRGATGDVPGAGSVGLIGRARRAGRPRVRPGRPERRPHSRKPRSARSTKRGTGRPRSRWREKTVTSSPRRT